MPTEQFTAIHESRETIAQPRRTLAELGFTERDSIKTGLTTAPVTTFSREMNNGDRLFAVAINYAVAGIGLESMLDRIGPNPGNLIIPRIATADDWAMPDNAAMGIQKDMMLDKAHRRIPGYNTFNIGHRVKWLEALNNTDSDQFYADRAATRFIDTTEFIISQSYKAESAHFGGVSPFERRTQLPPYDLAEVQLVNEFTGLRFGLLHIPLMFVDPMTGLGVRQLDEREPVVVQLGSLGKNVVLEANDIAAHISLGKVNRDGFYEEDAVRLTYPDS